MPVVGSNSFPVLFWRALRCLVLAASLLGSAFASPAQDLFNIELNLSQIEYLNFELYDAQGKLVTVLLRDWIKVLQNTFQFSLRDVSSGIYYVKIIGNKGTNITKKIIKN